MTECNISRKEIRKIYRKIYQIYYMNSILNKILLGEYDFTYIEMSTITDLNDRCLNSLRKLVLNKIPFN